MTAAVALINFGGRRGCSRLVTISCDAEGGCAAAVQYSDKESYLEAGNAGWRRRGDGEGARFYCPAHAAAAAAS